MNEIDIVKRLQDSGFKGYFVGGYIRNKILGLKSKDIDITTNASPEQIVELFSDQKVKNVGKAFLITLVNNIEVATFRKDLYKGLNNKNATIEQVDDERIDVKRRDFTINSILYDPIADKIYDYVNGLKDLQEKIIRFNGDPEHGIWEDPNRIIRACRFRAQIDGSFDEKTFNALKKYSDYVSTLVSPNRIRMEILKAMDIKKASIFFRSLYEIDALQYIFPSLNNCYGTEGGPYHIEEVFDHCMMSGDHCNPKHKYVKLAAYLHDVGKGISKRINPKTNKIWFQGHEKSGSEAVKNELYDLKFSLEEINIISSLIYLHMRISNERLNPKAIRRTLVMLKDRNIFYRDLIRIAICDRKGNTKWIGRYTIENVRYLCSLFRKEIYRKDPVNKFSDLKVNGYDVMKITGLTPGKQVGEILEKLMEKVIDNPNNNDRSKLLDLIKKINIEGEKNDNI
jgi:tRNA nucleotidyltransferase/poly(A) polymerase